MAKKSKLDETDLRQDLTANFVTKLRDKWLECGDRVLDELSTKSPEKFALLVGHIVPREMLLAGGRGDFSECQSREDIGRQLLLEVGAPEAGITADMVAAAAAENERFVDRLMQIAGGN